MKRKVLFEGEMLPPWGECFTPDQKQRLKARVDRHVQRFVTQLSDALVDKTAITVQLCLRVRESDADRENTAKWAHGLYLPRHAVLAAVRQVNPTIRVSWVYDWHGDCAQPGYFLAVTGWK